MPPEKGDLGRFCNHCCDPNCSVNRNQTQDRDPCKKPNPRPDHVVSSSSLTGHATRWTRLFRRRTRSSRSLARFSEHPRLHPDDTLNQAIIDYVNAKDISEFGHGSRGEMPTPTKVRRCRWVAASDHVASNTCIAHSLFMYSNHLQRLQVRPVARR